MPRPVLIWTAFYEATLATLQHSTILASNNLSVTSVQTISASVSHIRLDHCRQNLTDHHQTLITFMDLDCIRKQKQLIQSRTYSSA